MNLDDRRRANEALDWVRRLHDPDFADWDAHLIWLETDTRNAAAFDKASTIISEASERLRPAGRWTSPQQPINDNAAPGSSRRWYRGGIAVVAIAAAIVGVVALPSLKLRSSQSYEIRTGPGEHHSLTLGDGTQIALNGDTRLRLDRGAPRVATLEAGEAFFIVTHDTAHPFEVHTGKDIFRDVGTAFDVVRQGNMTDVEVREGAVLFDPDGAAVLINEARAIHVEGGTATVRSSAATDIGGWRTGRLSYRDATLAQVARDVSRAIGRTVAVGPELAQRHFSGVIMINPDHALTLRRMGAVMGVELEPDGADWRMVLPTR
jgi:transmembrane sensor